MPVFQLISGYFGLLQLKLKGRGHPISNSKFKFEMEREKRAEVDREIPEICEMGIVPDVARSNPVKPGRTQSNQNLA